MGRAARADAQRRSADLPSARDDDSDCALVVVFHSVAQAVVRRHAAKGDGCHRRRASDALRHVPAQRPTALALDGQRSAVDVPQRGAVLAVYGGDGAVQLADNPGFESTHPPGFVSKFDCEKNNSAFNLNLVSELAPLHHGNGPLRCHVGACPRRQRTVQVLVEVGSAAVPADVGAVCARVAGGVAVRRLLSRRHAPAVHRELREDCEVEVRKKLFM